MNRAELLDKAKIAANVKTDYALAKVLGVKRQVICSVRKEKIKADAYTVYKIALILNADPAQLIAELEAEQEKDEQRREFWVNFLLRVSKQVALIVLLAPSFIYFWSSEANASGRSEAPQRGLTERPIIGHRRLDIIRGFLVGFLDGSSYRHPYRAPLD